MKNEKLTRREAIKKTVGVGLSTGAVMGAPQWILPALAQGEELVSFSDMPEGYSRGPARPGAPHWLDTRMISDFYTDNLDFYVVQHYGQPDVDIDSYRLKVTGLVEKELEYTLADLQNLSQFEIDAGFECGGNNAGRFQGLVGNAKWKGIRLSSLLNASGITSDGTEVVFFGADSGTEEIPNRDTEVEQSFARSLPVSEAMREENMLALEMNGEELPQGHGFPARLLIPGHYGVANVKWLTQIQVQDRRYMGRFMGRDYVTLKKEMVGGEERWVENSVTKIQLKSAIVRVTRLGAQHKISGFVLTDGTPLRSVEIKIDDGPWREADLDSRSTRYSWKLFTMDWSPSAGNHTLVSRAIDINGHVQLTEEEMPEKASRWENHAQFPRAITIS